jgi:hypothetical protein
MHPVNYLFPLSELYGQSLDFRRFFGPNRSPLLQVGYRSLVEVDAGFHIRLINLEDYKRSSTQQTWSCIEKYSSDLKNRNVKIAFFSATPQGGGVALMRHSFVRFAATLGVDMKWFVNLFPCISQP